MATYQGTSSGAFWRAYLVVLPFQHRLDGHPPSVLPTYGYSHPHGAQLEVFLTFCAASPSEEYAILPVPPSATESQVDLPFRAVPCPLGMYASFELDLPLGCI